MGYGIREFYKYDKEKVIWEKWCYVLKVYNVYNVLIFWEEDE